MKVLIACGGTGGHIFPGISLAQALNGRKEVKDILLVGTDHPLERKIFNSAGLSHRLLPVAKFSANPIGFLLFLIRFTAASFKSLGLLLSFRPDVVVGFGGYASFPICASASIAGIPLYVHEQNYLPGLANKVLAAFAKAVAVSFKETEGLFKSKTIVIGNPIRKRLFLAQKEEALSSFGFHGEKFTILIMGGSQGAHSINILVTELLRLLTEEEKRGLRIIHIAGARDYEDVLGRYKECEIESGVFDFIDDIGRAYKSADLVISRAGATALFEIAALGIPSILIPYRYAGGHQYHNARALELAGGTMVLDEKDLTAAALKEKIYELKDDKAGLGRISGCARKFSVPDAAKRLADYILEV